MKRKIKSLTSKIEGGCGGRGLTEITLCVEGIAYRSFSHIDDIEYVFLNVT